MKWLFDFFKSKKLAIVLFLFIAITSVIATLIPQGEEELFYTQKYSRFIAGLIMTTQFNAFFKSVIFLVPSSLFFLNLSVCTFDRLYKRLKNRAKPRFGPDFIHVGILILIVGAIVTFSTKREGNIWMGEDDQIELPGGYLLHLRSYRYLQYEDGRPKDWISTVDVSKGSELIISSYPIEVNKPLKVGPWRVYQASYRTEINAMLRDSEGILHVIKGGHVFEGEDAAFYCAAIESSPTDAAVFEKWVDRTRTDVLHVSVGSQIGPYTLEGASSREVTGLNVVSDPGYLPVIIALILISVGLSLTYIQKIGDKAL